MLQSYVLCCLFVYLYMYRIRICNYYYSGCSQPNSGKLGKNLVQNPCMPLSFPLPPLSLALSVTPLLCPLLSISLCLCLSLILPLPSLFDTLLYIYQGGWAGLYPWNTSNTQ